MGRLVYRNGTVEYRTDSPEQEILALHREPADPDLVLGAFCPRLHFGTYGLSRHDVLWLDEKVILADAETRARYATAAKRRCRCGEVVHLV